MFEKDQKVILSDALVAKLIQSLPPIREVLKHSGNIVKMLRFEDRGVIFIADSKSASFQFYLSSADTLQHTRRVPDEPSLPIDQHIDKIELTEDECNCPTCLAERSVKERGVEIQKMHSPREVVIVHHCYNVIDRYLGYRSNNALSSLAKYSQHKASQQHSDPLMSVDSGEGYISINLGGEEQKLLDAACKQLRKIIEDGPEPSPQSSRAPVEQPRFQVMEIDASSRDKLRAALAAAFGDAAKS